MSSASERLASGGGIIIGVGHAERQDDGVGPYVAKALSQRGVPAVAHEGDGSGLLELWQDRSVCIVVDAIGRLDDGTQDAGRIHIFTEVEDAAFSRAAFVHSSHRVGLPEAVALGAALDRLPGRLIVIGIVGVDFGFGCELSAPVANAADRVIKHFASAESSFSRDTIAALARL